MFEKTGLVHRWVWDVFCRSAFFSWNRGLNAGTSKTITTKKFQYIAIPMSREAKKRQKKNESFAIKYYRKAVVLWNEILYICGWGKCKLEPIASRKRVVGRSFLNQEMILRWSVISQKTPGNAALAQCRLSFRMIRIQKRRVYLFNKNF